MGKFPIWIAILMLILPKTTGRMSNRPFLTNNASIGWINTQLRPSLYTQRGNKLSGKSFAQRNFCLKNFSNEVGGQEKDFFEVLVF